MVVAAANVTVICKTFENGANLSENTEIIIMLRF